MFMAAALKSLDQKEGVMFGNCTLTDDIGIWPPLFNLVFYD